MIEFYDLMNILPNECYILLCDCNGYVVQEGINGETMWEDVLLGTRVDRLYGGEKFTIFLDYKHMGEAL